MLGTRMALLEELFKNLGESLPFELDRRYIAEQEEYVAPIVIAIVVRLSVVELHPALLANPPSRTTDLTYSIIRHV